MSEIEHSSPAENMGLQALSQKAARDAGNPAHHQASSGAAIPSHENSGVPLGSPPIIESAVTIPGASQGLNNLGLAADASEIMKFPGVFEMNPTELGNMEPVIGVGSTGVTKNDLQGLSQGASLENASLSKVAPPAIGAPIPDRNQGGQQVGG